MILFVLPEVGKVIHIVFVLHAHACMHACTYRGPFLLHALLCIYIYTCITFAWHTRHTYIMNLRFFFCVEQRVCFLSKALIRGMSAETLPASETQLAEFRQEGV